MRALLLSLALLLVGCAEGTPMPITDVLICSGQSNSIGANPGESGTYAAVRYWRTIITTGVNANAYANLSSPNGKAVSLARVLLAAGRSVAYIDIGQGSTSSSEWTPPSGVTWQAFAPELAQAIAALPAEFPGRTFRYWHIRDQGENEALQSIGSPGPAQAWAEQFELIHAAVEAIVGQHVNRIIIQTHDTMTGGNHAATVQAEQLTAAGDAAHLVDRDACDYESDGVHLTTAGYITLGELVAARILELSPMGSISTYSKNKLIDHVRNKAAHTPAATHYLHLYSAGSTPISGNGYAVVSKTNNTTTWPAASGRAKSNGVAWTFPTPTGTWPDVTEWRLTDSATEGAGNVLASDTITPVPVSVATGPISFEIGAIDITCPAGGFVDSVVHGLLNLMFGGTAHTQLATTYGSYWAGDPQGAGSQAGSRVAMTQATVWGAASSGMAVSVAAVTLAQQVSGTYWAEHDASSGGNLIFSATRPAATGASGTIQAGQLQTTIT